MYLVSENDLERRLLDPAKGGSWLPGEPIMWLKGLECSVPPPAFGGGENGWRLNWSPLASDLANHDYVPKPPQKPKGSFWDFLLTASKLGNHQLPRATFQFPCSQRTEVLFFRTSFYVSFHLAIYSFNIIL